MEYVVSVNNMRSSDEATIRGGVKGTELMLRAGKGILDHIKENRLLKDVVYIVCGSGNNAGDGYVLALLLHKENVPVRIIRVVDKCSDDGGYFYDLCQKEGIKSRLISTCGESVLKGTSGSDTKEKRQAFYLEKEACLYEEIKESLLEGKACTVVDCIFGTGFKGTPKEPYISLIRDINQIKKEFGSLVSVVAADINSGLNGDNGICDECVISDLTISIGNTKSGHYLNMAKDVIGKLTNVDIGIKIIDKPYMLFEKEDAKNCLYKRKNFSNKGDYGYVSLIGGSSKYPGAIALAGMANAAMRAGSGVVMIAVPESIRSLVEERVLESTVYPLSSDRGNITFVKEEINGLINRVKAIAFGMGIGRGEEIKKILTYILDNYKGILIIDADGLNCLADMGISKTLAESKAKVILTPHLKEFSRLSGYTVDEIKDNPIELACEMARNNGALILLKGPTTIVTDGDTVYLINRGCPGMATAGSGDVLSGIMAAVCGYNTDRVLEAVATAAYINGISGELAQEEYGDISMIASDTISFIPKAIRQITDENGNNDNSKNK